MDRQGEIESSPPHHFVCPLTLEIMENPVKDPARRHSYEKKAIFTWLETSGLCPMTRQPLEPEDLVADKDLKKQIKKWKEQHRRSDCTNGHVNPDNNEDTTETAKRQDRSSKAIGDRLLGIRSRVLARRSERINFSSDDSKNLSQDPPNSLGYLIAQSFQYRHENALHSMAIKQRAKRIGDNRLVGKKDKKLSSRLSHLISSVVDDVWDNDDIFDDDEF